MTLEEAIKNFEQEIGEFEGLKKIQAVTYEDYEYIEKTRQLVEWLRELQERRKQPKIIYCKDCKHYHPNVWGSELGIDGMYGNIIVAHNACDRWTKDMNCVEPEGFCFLAERRTMTDIGDICDYCFDEERDCKMCSLGNPCLNCEDYDTEYDRCKSNGTCYDVAERRTDERH